MQARHFVIDDGNADGVLTAGNITMYHEASPEKFKKALRLDTYRLRIKKAHRPSRWRVSFFARIITGAVDGVIKM
jgi:hypothetical protein